MDPIQVGQVLDKYELLERVGQGGMAIVYRGLDRSLKREVAVKILHRHLSDYQEARDRFEREAQAVAKLRHENILEIFDYSGARDAEAAGASYIITEFIDGQTLKQFITDRPIAFPEIGAMIVLQVCRALAHAHGAQVLHRDVKPENIMIRTDGVVKLMDFGISHMVDLERLTVTGQLLGSPAYMAPEHVEGRPIDFRTDVFAAGIVLYQLTVGKLPFEGRNPHEVLKRIADCKYVDPRQANPRIGNRLGRIILRAMAPAPDDRYSAISEMVIALERYLEESGLGPAPGELARYFQNPASYDQALKERLLHHLTQRGQRLLAEDQADALDAFDRVLTMDPSNARVLAILDGINRRRKLKTAALVAVGLVALVGGGIAVQRAAAAADARRPKPPIVTPSPHPIVAARFTPDAAVGIVIADAGTAARIVDAADDTAVAELPDARRPASTVPTLPPATHDAAPTAPPADIAVELTVSPRNSEVQLGDGAWQTLPGGREVVQVDQEVKVHVRNVACCEEQEVTLRPGDHARAVSLGLLPGRVVPSCTDPGVTARVDGKPANLGELALVSFGESALSTRSVTVEFFGKTGTLIASKEVRVSANSQIAVSCAHD